MHIRPRLAGVNPNAGLWIRYPQIGGEIEATYWRRAPVFWMSEE